MTIILRFFDRNFERLQADFENAVKNACQCFEDGIAVIFLEGKRLETLEERIALREDSELTFVRMTMLAGRMW
ncbi:MAG: hypothetical protein SOV79_02450 [Eisenbergiella porci]|uniref:hypothetical protein n=1 Tax=Eisenbergiella porci TaxID=2652274 RepID=UPI002A749DD9|nr:hypothetical protein [Eisenbergiella porci]MDY2651448.1 hypothetical protein [Eisenbergiella porci]